MTSFFHLISSCREEDSDMSASRVDKKQNKKKTRGRRVKMEDAEEIPHAGYEFPKDVVMCALEVLEFYEDENAPVNVPALEAILERINHSYCVSNEIELPILSPGGLCLEKEVIPSLRSGTVFVPDGFKLVVKP